MKDIIVPCVVGTIKGKLEIATRPMLEPFGEFLD